MAVLVPGQWNLHPEGDVFEVDEETLARLDALELAGPYARGEIALREGPTVLAYVAAEPLRWAELVWAGLADAVETYTATDTEPKPCCVAQPGHAPPHDAVDPLDPERLADAKLRNLARGFAAGSVTSLHVLEATAATTHTAFGRDLLATIIDWRASGADRADLAARLA
jgi:hypothetical protein